MDTHESINGGIRFKKVITSQNPTKTIYDVQKKDLSTPFGLKL